MINIRREPRSSRLSLNCGQVSRGDVIGASCGTRWSLDRALTKIAESCSEAACLADIQAPRRLKHHDFNAFQCFSSSSRLVICGRL